MNANAEEMNGRKDEQNVHGGLISNSNNYQIDNVDVPIECKLEVLSEGEDEQQPKDTGVKEENTDPKETTEDESMAVEALRQLGGMFNNVPPTMPPPSSVVQLRQHVCNICWESFERKTDLGNHIVCHQTDRPHACRICGNLFRRKADLQNHMVCHQVERPHRCPQCGADFNRPSSLTNHMKIHTYSPGRALLSSGSSLANFQEFSKKPSTTVTNAANTITTVTEVSVVHVPSCNGWDSNDTNNVPPEIHNYQQQSSRLTKENATSEFNFQSTPLPVISSVQTLNNDESVTCEQASKVCTLNESGNMQINNITNNTGISINSNSFREFNVKTEDVNSIPTSEESYNVQSNNESKSLDDSSRRPHVCRHCGRAFARGKALESHARLHQDNWGSPVECDRCEEMFPEEASLRQHQRTCVGKLNNHQLHEYQQQQHHHQQQQQQQQQLQRQYEQQQAEQIQQQSVKPNLMKAGKHACLECDKKFTTKQKLFRHMWIHRKRPFVCEVCGISLADRTALDEHRRKRHPGDSPYTCNECGKSFASRQGLWEHGRLHSGNGSTNYSPFICQRCGKSFASRQGHLIHMRTHTGERPYGCRFCWKAFRDGGTLRKHERIHTGERPHVCPLCPRAFNQKVVLREHVRWVHAARSSDGCQYCGYVISDREALCAHIVRHSDQLAAAAKAAAKGKREQPKVIIPQNTVVPQEVVPLEQFNPSNISSICNEGTDTNNKNIPEEKKGFSCDMCGEKFGLRTDLVSHVRIHI